MKEAREFEKCFGEFLTTQERAKLTLAIRFIMDNHKDDEWWKIYNAVLIQTQTQLNLQLSNDSFDESMKEGLE